MDKDYIWAAGFLDGEGCFTLKRSRLKSGYIYHQPMICCSQTIKGKVVIEFLKELFGGSYHEYEPNSGDRIRVATWSVVSKDALRCADKLVPYLRVKKKGAELIQKFYAGKEVFKYRIPKEELDRRELLYIESRKLNVKGKLKFQLQRLNEKTPQGEATV